MGQYYKPIILASNKKSIVGYWHSHKIGQGLKLMEHSYINTGLCNCVENYLKKNGGARLVWAGDYADADREKITQAEAKTIWQEKVAKGEILCGFKTFWKSNAPELYRPQTDNDENLYSKCSECEDDNGKIIRKGKPELEYNSVSDDDNRYLVNDDKKEYVDMWDVIALGGSRIHPLPLLTSEGNGRGGGDYWGLDDKYVGSWARDFIRVMPCGWNTINELKLKGYTQIKPKFVETYDIRQTFVQSAELLVEVLNGEYGCSDDANYVAQIRLALDKVKKALPTKTEAEKRVIAQLQENA